MTNNNMKRTIEEKEKEKDIESPRGEKRKLDVSEICK